MIEKNNGIFLIKTLKNSESISVKLYQFVNILLKKSEPKPIIKSREQKP